VEVATCVENQFTDLALLEQFARQKAAADAGCHGDQRQIADALLDQPFDTSRGFARADELAHHHPHPGSHAGHGRIETGNFVYGQRGHSSLYQKSWILRMEAFFARRACGVFSNPPVPQYPNWPRTR
jgi:hypothetical protein